jgi:UDP-N-acetyl-D-glucosamine dehydrogenase
MKIAVVGLGYVGLPLAIEANRVGIAVLGLDTDATLVSELVAGRSHIEDVSSENLKEALGAGFEPSSDPFGLSRVDAIIITVPTPLTGHLPDLSAVRSAAATIGDHLQRGQLVILESTSYPGTTEEVVGVILEQKTGLVPGQDFHLAFSPERIDPGNGVFGLRNTPKVVGGVNEASTDAAAALYGRFVEQVVPVSGTREAEMSKLLENTYRHINIALVNEMAVFCHEMGIDLWESIRAASSKGFGFQAFYPGPGVGGHCIPIDPNYLSSRVRELGYPFRFVELAQEINNRMPAYVIGRVSKLLNHVGRPVNGTRILLLGVAYKADISDVRESPATEIARRLIALGADVSYADPHVERFMVDGRPVLRSTDVLAALEETDLALLLVAHSAFDLHAIAEKSPRLLDTRGVASGRSVERL